MVETIRYRFCSGGMNASMNYNLFEALKKIRVKHSSKAFQISRDWFSVCWIKSMPYINSIKESSGESFVLVELKVVYRAIHLNWTIIEAKNLFEI